MEDKMKNVFKKIDGVKTGIFAAGVLFGTAEDSNNNSGECW